MFKVRTLFLLNRLVLLRKLAKFVCCIVSLFYVNDETNIGAVVTNSNKAAPSSYTTSHGRAINRMSRYNDFYFV